MLLKWFPEDREELKKLPGVSDYVSGVVLSFANNKKEWIVDSNIVRVFQHFLGIETSKEGRRDKLVIELAKIYVDCESPKKLIWRFLIFLHWCVQRENRSVRSVWWGRELFIL